MKSRVSPEQERQRLQSALNRVNKELNRKIEEENMPEFKKRFEGKYFKSRNSYGSDSSWWLYVKVVSVDSIYSISNGVSAYFTGWSFQTCSYNTISIEQNRKSYVHALDIEITEKEFIAAYDKMIDKINSLA